MILTGEMLVAPTAIAILFGLLTRANLRAGGMGETVAEGAEPLNDASPERFREGIEWREIDGEILLHDVRTSQCVSLNETGSLLWLSMAEGATRDHLVGLLVGRFRITGEQASADVDAFLQDLAWRGFLRRP